MKNKFEKTLNWKPFDEQLRYLFENYRRWASRTNSKRRLAPMSTTFKIHKQWLLFAKSSHTIFAINCGTVYIQKYEKQQKKQETIDKTKFCLLPVQDAGNRHFGKRLKLTGFQGNDPFRFRSEQTSIQMNGLTDEQTWMIRNAKRTDTNGLLCVFRLHIIHSEMNE